MSLKIAKETKSSKYLKQNKTKKKNGYPDHSRLVQPEKELFYLSVCLSVCLSTTSLFDFFFFLVVTATLAEKNAGSDILLKIYHPLAGSLFLCSLHHQSTQKKKKKKKIIIIITIIIIKRKKGRKRRSKKKKTIMQNCIEATTSVYHTTCSYIMQCYGR